MRIALALEKLSIVEAQRSFTYFHLFGYPSDLVVCNRVLPSGKDSDGSFAGLRATQQRYLPEVVAQFAPVPVRTVPAVRPGDDRARRLTEIGGALFGEDDPTGFFYRGRPYQVRAEDGGHVLEVALPFTSRDDVQLTRDGDELLPPGRRAAADDRPAARPRGRPDDGCEDGGRRPADPVPGPRRGAANVSEEVFDGRLGDRRAPPPQVRARLRPACPTPRPGCRMAELEARLARLEGEPTLKERGRRMMDRVMPPEAGQHFRNAGREQLLGVRSIVDFWIRRIDDAESRARGDAGRETIEID